MGPKRKRSSSARASSTQRTSNRKSIKKLETIESSDNKPTTNLKDTKKSTTKTKVNQQVKYNVGEEVQYDPIHTRSTRRAQGKITKVLTGTKKSDPSTKEVRYVIQNDNTGKETIYGQHSVKNKAKK